MKHGHVAWFVLLWDMTRSHSCVSIYTQKGVWKKILWTEYKLSHDHCSSGSGSWTRSNERGNARIFAVFSCVLGFYSPYLYRILQRAFHYGYKASHWRTGTSCGYFCKRSSIHTSFTIVSHQFQGFSSLWLLVKHWMKLLMDLIPISSIAFQCVWG